MTLRPVRGVLLAALLTVSCRQRPAPAPAAVDRKLRDVVLVTIDTLRYDAVGFDGNPRGTTPHLDRFASEGRVFIAAHSHNVVTLPSHTNILTGLYPYQHGVRDNAGFRLAAKVPTLGTMLKEKGYVTGAFVAAFILDARYGLARGFDVYEGLYDHTDEPHDFEVRQARADEVVKAALAWWRSQEGKRRFLWVHVYDPHAAYDPPQEFEKRFPDDLYLGEVAFTDAALSPLLEAVRAVRPAPLLIVTADHGEARGDHGEMTHSLFGYEATLHVPLFAWCPDLVTPGRDATAARHVDIAPTFLDALGDVTDRKLPGKSLLSANRAEAPEGSYFEALSAALNRGWAPLRGLIQGAEKYVDLPVPELYDLRTDPEEAKNLAVDRRDSIRRLRPRLTAIPAGPMERGTIGSEEAATLRGLGYLTGSAEQKASYGPADDPKNLIAVDRQLHEVVDQFQRGHLDESLAVSRRVVASNPRMKLGYVQLTFLLQEKGDMAGAIRVFEEARKNGAGGESLDRRHAMLLAEMGRPAEALALLETHRQTDDPDTLNAIGIALTDAGRAAEGLAVFARALAIDPRSAQAHQDSALALLQLGRLDEALRSVETALSISPRNARALNTLGVVQSRLGAPEKAIDAWSRCVVLNPKQYDALYNLGRVAGGIGDFKRARQALEQFVATAPPARYRKDLAEVRAVLAAMGRDAARPGQTRTN